MARIEQTKQPEPPKKTEATRHISERETLNLWVRSGGRCAMCNTFLLEEPVLERPINLGERAHIAGWTDTAGSPRSDSTVPLPDRNKGSNLLLLCQDCHTVIDHPDTRAEYPEERLLSIKHEHEDRIHHLTAMGLDRETAVLRLFGSIRGSVPEMARSLAIQTVVDGAGRYARFPFAPDRHSVEIDLSRLPEPEDDDAYWRLGQAQIDKAMVRIADHVSEKQVRHLSIFAVARIPLLMYLGFALDDKVPIDLYQKHRGDKEGWIWPEDGSEPAFKIVAHRDGEPGGDVALILSLSGTVPLTDLPPEVEGLAVFEILPADATPNPNLFRSRAMLNAFVRTWQDLLSQLEVTHKTTPCIHVFPAVPITAAVAFGRVVMRHVHPAIRVYDRIGGTTFCPALTMNAREAQQ